MNSNSVIKRHKLGRNNQDRRRSVLIQEGVVLSEQRYVCEGEIESMCVCEVVARVEGGAERLLMQRERVSLVITV